MLFTEINTWEEHEEKLMERKARAENAIIHVVVIQRVHRHCKAINRVDKLPAMSIVYSCRNLLPNPQLYALTSLFSICFLCTGSFVGIIVHTIIAPISYSFSTLLRTNNNYVSANCDLNFQIKWNSHEGNLLVISVQSCNLSSFIMKTVDKWQLHFVRIPKVN